MSKRFALFCQSWRIRNLFATPSHLKTNGLVERLNKTLAAVISAYVNVNHDD